MTYSLLNAADFGVPQQRQRIFIVGFKRGQFKFPNQLKSDYITCYDALSDLPADSTKLNKYLCAPKNRFQLEMRGKMKFPPNNEVTSHSQKTIDIISMVPDGGSIKDLPEKYWKVNPSLCLITVK